MANKKTTKKVASKKVTRPVEKIVFTYKMTMSYNGITFNVMTNDLHEAILAATPKVLKTKIHFLIEKDGKVCERQVFVQRGKMLFKNKVYLDLFIRKLIFK